MRKDLLKYNLAESTGEKGEELAYTILEVSQNLEMWDNVNLDKDLFPKIGKNLNFCYVITLFYREYSGEVTNPEYDQG